MKKMWGFFRDWSLKWKWLTLMALVMLPMMAVGFLVLDQFDDILLKHSLGATERILDKTELNLTEAIQSVEDISRYMIYSDDIQTFMTSSAHERTEHQLDTMIDQIRAFTTFQLMSKKYINSVSIQAADGTELSLGEPMHGDEEKWIRRAAKAKGKIVWSDPYTIHSGWGGSKQVITLFRVINDIESVNKPIGRISIRINAKELYQLMAAGTTPKEGNVFIFNENGTVLLGNHEERWTATYSDHGLIERVIDKAGVNFRYEQAGITYLVVSREMNKTGWYIVAMMKEEEILKEMQGIRVQFLATIMLSMLLALFVLIGFYYFMIRPVLELTKGTVRVEKGDFTVSVPIRSNDEIGNLGRRFNIMVATVKNLIDTQYKFKIKQRESELKMLLNQLDPHFLYNTLDTIRWTARLEKAVETSRLIEALSRHFRISLHKGKAWIKLHEEFKLVESYLELQKKRLGNLTYTLFVDARVSDAIVLKKVIQPLVENSIVHGFHGRKQNNRIQVRCYPQKQDLCIDVIDNGRGFDFNKIRTYIMDTTEHQSYALRNINERLINAFGTNYGVEIVENADSVAWIRLTLPLLWDEEEVERAMKSEGKKDGDQNADS